MPTYRTTEAKGGFTNALDAEEALRPGLLEPYNPYTKATTTARHRARTTQLRPERQGLDDDAA